MDVEQMIPIIAENGKKNIALHSMDYVKDGLLYCYKCNSPKQTVIHSMTVPTLCECEVKERDEQEHKNKVIKLRENGIPDKRLYACTFANDDGKNPGLTKLARLYVDNFNEHYKKGKGLLLFGDVGYGKTYAALSIANDLIDQEISCKFTDFPTILREWEGQYGHKDDYLRRLNACDCLIIDDFGTERKTEYTQEVVFSVINTRLNSGLPFVITTNTPKSEFINPTDISQKRIFSRLLGASIAYECKGRDRRLDSFVETNKEAKKHLSETLINAEPK